MERTWLETIQLLGLDIEVALIFVALAVAAVTRLASAAAGALRRRARRKAGVVPTTPMDAWPAQDWRHSN